jgi:mono/diheme cytochrome c family protein
MRTGKAFVPHLKAALKIFIILAAALAMNSAAAESAQGTGSVAANAPERELIPGADRMTGAERDAYRRRMAEAATPAEKAKIRAEYAKAAEAMPGNGKAPDAPAPEAALVGDPARGATLHQGCFGCHGIERYVSPVTYAMATFTDSVLRASGLSDLPPVEPKRFKGRASSLTALRDGVIRRNEFLNPKMTPQEIEDVVAYLNATYYKFPQ